MIKKVSFTGKGKEDYINTIRYKTVLKKGVTPEQFEEAKKKRASYRELNNMVKEVRDGYENPTLRQCVLKHDFLFEPDKINVIFGPNGSGKTTILKTIAEHCMCGHKEDGNDGYTSLLKYHHSMALFDWDDRDETVDEVEEKIEKVIEKKAGNQAEVVWDGQPVYYENLSGRRSYGEVGNLVGGIIESFTEEMMWHIEQKSTSAGQKTMYIINKLGRVIHRCPKVDDLIKENRKEHKGEREYGKTRLDAIMKYFEKHYVSTDNPYPTILLDEMDKSLDLLNVMSLYADVLPAIREKFHVQIIVVSHSPVVLMDRIFNSENYHIVSMSEKYTKECRKRIKELL